MNLRRVGLLLGFAFHSVLAHRRRNATLMLAVFVVTTLLVLLFALSNGISDTILRSATSLSTGDVNVGGFYKPTPSQFVPAIIRSARVESIIRSSVPELAGLTRRGRGWAKLVSQVSSKQTGVTGVDIREEPQLREVLDIAAGDLTRVTQKNSIVLFQSQATKLDLAVGDVLTLSAQTSAGVANTLDCRVVAIARDVGLLGRWNVFVSNETLRSLYQLDTDVVGAFHLRLSGSSRKDPAVTAQHLRQVFKDAGYRLLPSDHQAFFVKFGSVSREDWVGQKLDVSTWQDELSFITWTLDILRALSATLTIILVGIVVAGFFNTMWIAVRERTREIGTLRAIGMQRYQVLMLFVLEAMLTGLVAATLGALAGAGAVESVNALNLTVPSGAQLFLMTNHLRLKLEPSILLQAILLLTAVTGLSALFPALRAARLRPATALSHTS